MANYSPLLDERVLDRLDNAYAICDTEFLLHPGFPDFVMRYFTRPFSSCLVLLSGVLEDIERTAYCFPETAGRVSLAKRLISSLADSEYCETNATFADRRLSVHGQIMRAVDCLRINHRICVLTNCSRTIESVSRLRKEQRKEARGVSCLRMSNRTNMPMVAWWHDSDKHAASMIGARTTEIVEPKDRSTGKPKLKSAEFYIREAIVQYKTTGHKKILSSQKEAIAVFVRSVMLDNSREHMIALYVDGAGYIMNYSVIAIGQANQVHFHPREIYQAGQIVGAVSIILVHNHPSGNLVPSPADINCIKLFDEAAKSSLIPVIDHMIVTDASFVSHSRKPWK